MVPNAETMTALRRVFNYAFHDGPWPKGYFIPEPHVVEGPFKLGDLEITPLPVPHGRIHTNGYLFTQSGKKRLAYLSDCKEVPDEMIDRIAGVKVLIVDALRHRLHPTHMNIEEALLVAAKVKADETWFTHICHELGHEETQKNLPPGVKLAYDGLKISI